MVDRKRRGGARGQGQGRMMDEKRHETKKKKEKQSKMERANIHYHQTPQQRTK